MDSVRIMERGPCLGFSKIAVPDPRPYESSGTRRLKACIERFECLGRHRDWWGGDSPTSVQHLCDRGAVDSLWHWTQQFWFGEHTVLPPCATSLQHFFFPQIGRPVQPGTYCGSNALHSEFVKQEAACAANGATTELTAGSTRLSPAAFPKMPSTAFRENCGGTSGNSIDSWSNCDLWRHSNAIHTTASSPGRPTSASRRVSCATVVRPSACFHTTAALGLRQCASCVFRS